MIPLIRIRLIAAAAGLSMFSALPIVPALAQQDKETMRAEQAAQSSSGEETIASLQGTRIQFKSYIETEAGYDSNPDNLFDEEGSAFVKAQAGLKIIASMPQEYYRLTLRGRFIDYTDLDSDIQHRSDFKAAIDTSYNLSDKATLYSGAYFLRDLISLARADIIESYSDYVLREDAFNLKLRSKSHIEHNFDNDLQGTDTFDDFSVSRARSFDFYRSDLQFNLLANKQGTIQPFLIGDGAKINYYNQTSGTSIDRDANEVYGIAGIRLQTSKDFRIDVGYRHNFRDIDDRVFSSAESGFVDINLFWRPIEGMRITGVVERYFQEPSNSFGIAEDVKSYGLTVDWDIAKYWQLDATAFYDQEDVIGIDRQDNKITTTMSLTYMPSQNVEYFLSGLAKWVEEDVSGDDYERYKIGLGARMKF